MLGARLLRSSLSVSPLWLAASLIGCGAAPADQGTTQGSAPIINGVASTADEDAAVWVGILTADGYPQGSCSGVLLAENVLLTARHCVSRTADGGIACTKDGKSVAGGAVLSDYPAERLAVVIGTTMGRTSKAAARGKQVFTTGAKNLCNNDIAIVVLDRKIAGAKFAKIRLDAPPVKGETITAVGWGVSNLSRSNRRNRRADIPIVTVGPATSSGGAVGPGEFQIGEGICSGDSGGPAFATTTGAVLGVVSRGGNGAPYDPETDPSWTQCVDSADYKTHNIYTRVDAFKDLVLQAFEAAGTDPWLEDGPDPRKAKLGEPCDGPDACRSGICIDAGGKKICSDPCDDATACPDGYVCSAVGAGKVCTPKPADPPADPAAPEPTVKGGCAVTSASAPASSATWLSGLALVAVGLRRRPRRSPGA